MLPESAPDQRNARYGVLPLLVDSRDGLRCNSLLIDDWFVPTSGINQFGVAYSCLRL